jgi:hypothetical protein
MPAPSLDALLAFALAMFWRATIVTYLTHVACAVLQLRSRCLHRWLTRLLTQADFPTDPACIADIVLRHPMIGSRKRRGDFITPPQLNSILAELDPATPAVSDRIRLWFDQAMSRATRDYRVRAGFVSSISAITVLAITDRTAFAHVDTLLLLWIPLSLGSPFWYYLLKRIVPILRDSPRHA